MDDGGAEAERLDERESEALGQARVDERGRAVEDDGEVGVVEEAERTHPSLRQARFVGDLRQGHVAPAVGADDEEREVGGTWSPEARDELGDPAPRVE